MESYDEVLQVWYAVEVVVHIGENGKLRCSRKAEDHIKNQQ